VYKGLTPRLDPELVAVVVAALAHPTCTANGEVISAGGGRVARLLIGATHGRFIPGLGPEDAAAAVTDICAEATDLGGVILPSCAMAEVDLIREQYPELAGEPLFAG
jgi:hypothetical protein